MTDFNQEESLVCNELGYSIHRGEVKNAFWLSSDIVSRAYSLGTDEDFFSNVNSIARVAMDELANQTNPDNQTSRADCYISLGHSVTNFAYPFREDSHPPADFRFTIRGSKVMVRKPASQTTESAPVKLVKLHQTKDGEKELYKGVRVFDANCYQQMQATITRLAELFVEELTKREILDQ